LRAVILYGKNDLRVEETEVPKIGPQEILVRVEAAAICGSDLRMFRNGYEGVSPNSPLILGHELSGIIEKAGREVRGYREGLPVTVAPNFGCGICDACVSGNTQLCDRYQALGIHLDGAFAEYVRIPGAAVQQGNVVGIPEGVSFAAAALIEPLSCVFNGSSRCKIGPGDVVLIIGAGPIGLMHAKLARMAGASRIILNDLNESRLETAVKIVSGLLASPGALTAEKLRGLTGGHGVDVCITACPSGQAQITALEVTNIGGRVLFFGGLPKDKSHVPLDTNLIHYKQLVVTGTTRSSLIQYRKTLRFVSERLVEVEDLITARHGIEQALAAFAQAVEGKGLKNLITFR
jgi:L-iditol 2-dehydrogenase